MKNIDEQTYKGILTLVVTILSARFKLLLPLVVILTILMVIDTVFGIRATVYERTHKGVNGVVSSQTVADGVWKKFSHMCIVFVALTLDIGVYFGAELFGATVNIYPIFGLATVVIYIGKELISLLENYTRCGNEPPAFLGEFGKAIMESASKKGERYVKDILKETVKDEKKD